jgi:hypothetical protein
MRARREKATICFDTIVRDTFKCFRSQSIPSGSFQSSAVARNIRLPLAFQSRHIAIIEPLRRMSGAKFVSEPCHDLKIWAGADLRTQYARFTDNDDDDQQFTRKD